MHPKSLPQKKGKFSHWRILHNRPGGPSVQKNACQGHVRAKDSMCTQRSSSVLRVRYGGTPVTDSS